MTIKKAIHKMTDEERQLVEGFDRLLVVLNQLDAKARDLGIVVSLSSYYVSKDDVNPKGRFTFDLTRDKRDFEVEIVGEGR